MQSEKLLDWRPDWHVGQLVIFVICAAVLWLLLSGAGEYVLPAVRKVIAGLGYDSAIESYVARTEYPPSLRAWRKDLYNACVALYAGVLLVIPITVVVVTWKWFSARHELRKKVP